MAIEIPLKSGASNSHSRFEMTLGDNLLSFELDYITFAGPAWSMNIKKNDEYVICGMMLEPNAEISKSYNAGIGRFFFTGDDVTLDNLGKNNRLIWVSDSEII